MHLLLILISLYLLALEVVLKLLLLELAVWVVLMLNQPPAQQIWQLQASAVMWVMKLVQLAAVRLVQRLDLVVSLLSQLAQALVYMQGLGLLRMAVGSQQPVLDPLYAPVLLHVQLVAAVLALILGPLYIHVLRAALMLMLTLGSVFVSLLELVGTASCWLELGDGLHSRQTTAPVSQEASWASVQVVCLFCVGVGVLCPTP